MADHARGFRDAAARGDPAQECSARHHEALARRAAGQPAAAYRDLLGARPAGLQPIQRAAAPVVQRAAHRADQGSQVRYQGNVWNVTVSAIHNPQMTLQRAPNHIVHVNWANAAYTILRANTVQDHDLRESDLEAGVDAYANLSESEQDQKSRTNFRAARVRALTMIKACALPHVNLQSQASLNAITLQDFIVTVQGQTLSGSGKPNEAAQWEHIWVEGQANNPRRTWTFVIDSDDPLPTSSQEPHVGWTVSAAQGTQAAVGNTFGHIWLDRVPVKR